MIHVHGYNVIDVRETYGGTTTVILTRSTDSYFGGTYRMLREFREAAGRRRLKRAQFPDVPLHQRTLPEACDLPPEQACSRQVPAATLASPRGRRPLRSRPGFRTARASDP